MKIDSLVLITFLIDNQYILDLKFKQIERPCDIQIIDHIYYHLSQFSPEFKLCVYYHQNSPKKYDLGRIREYILENVNLDFDEFKKQVYDTKEYIKLAYSV